MATKSQKNSISYSVWLYLLMMRNHWVFSHQYSGGGVWRRRRHAPRSNADFPAAVERSHLLQKLNV